MCIHCVHVEFSRSLRKVIQAGHDEIGKTVGIFRSQRQWLSDISVRKVKNRIRSLQKLIRKESTIKRCDGLRDSEYLILRIPYITY